MGAEDRPRDARLPDAGPPGGPRRRAGSRLSGPRLTAPLRRARRLAGRLRRALASGWRRLVLPPAKPGSWSVVAMVKGEPATILPFIAHHLTLGCDEIHLYLDGPDPEVAALLAPLGRVRLTVCDDAFWARLGGRPIGRAGGGVPRQLALCRHVRPRVRTEWLIHIDNDEFLHPEGGGAVLAAELAACPPGIDWLRIVNLERVLRSGRPQDSLFDGQFRSRAPDAATARRIYGADARFLKLGLSGHVRGKVAIRARAPLILRVHDAVWPDRETGIAPPDAALPPFRVMQSTRLLHFDGWTARHWVAKLRTRSAPAGHAGRRRQIAWMAEAADDAARLALFHRLQCVPAGRARAMRAQGMLHDIGLDPGPALAAVFPGLALSLSAAGFDARRAAAEAAAAARAPDAGG